MTTANLAYKLGPWKNTPSNRNLGLLDAADARSSKFEYSQYHLSKKWYQMSAAATAKFFPKDILGPSTKLNK